MALRAVAFVALSGLKLFGSAFDATKKLLPEPDTAKHSRYTNRLQTLNELFTVYQSLQSLLQR